MCYFKRIRVFPRNSVKFDQILMRLIASKRAFNVLRLDLQVKSIYMGLR